MRAAILFRTCLAQAGLRLRALWAPTLLAVALCGGTLLGFSSAFLATPSVVVAQAADTAAESAEESRAESFQAVEGAVQEDIAGGPLMLAVYAVTWVFIFLYVLRLVSLQQRTLKEVERLSTQLASGQARTQE